MVISIQANLLSPVAVQFNLFKRLPSGTRQPGVSIYPLYNKAKIGFVDEYVL